MITGLILAVAALFGWGLLERNKRESSESLLQNQKTKEEITKLDGVQQENSAHQQLEEERRTDIKNEANEKKSEPISDNGLLDYFRKLK